MHRLVPHPLTLPLLAIAGLAGCSTTPAAPEKPDGLMRITINNPALMAEVMNQYYRSLATPTSPAITKQHIVATTIGAVVDKHLPADYQIYLSPDVDLSQPLRYDDARSWTESLGASLADVGIEMTANLDSKVIALKLADTTITQVIDRFLPADLTVFADEHVNLGTVVKYDRRLPWMEAFGKALAPIGMGFTANLTTRVIELRQKPASPDSTIAPSDTPSPEALAHLQARALFHAD